MRLCGHAAHVDVAATSLRGPGANIVTLDVQVKIQPRLSPLSRSWSGWSRDWSWYDSGYPHGDGSGAMAGSDDSGLALPRLAGPQFMGPQGAVPSLLVISSDATLEDL